MCVVRERTIKEAGRMCVSFCTLDRNLGLGDRRKGEATVTVRRFRRSYGLSSLDNGRQGQVI